MEYRKTTTPSYVNFYLIAANVIYFLFVEWKGSTEDVECMLQWGAMFKPAIVEGKQILAFIYRDVYAFWYPAPGQ